MALGGLLLLLVGALTRGWFVASGPGGSLSVGFLGVEFCEKGRACVDLGWDKEQELRLAGLAALIGTLTYALFLGGAALFSIARPWRAPRGLAITSFVLGILAVLGAIGLMSLASDAWQRGASAGYSGWVYLLGALIGVVASWVMWRAPVASAVGPTASGPIPACVRCNGPTMWVAQYGRYYCERCRAYL